MLHDIIEVKVVGDHRLYFRFDDGVSGEVDVSKLVQFEGVFAALRDPAAFREVRLNEELGTVFWPGGGDLDPDVLHSHITGKSVDASARN